MNRDRLKILRDHLAGLPDERVRMENLLTAASGRDCGITAQMGSAAFLTRCGTAACIAGWTNALFNPKTRSVASEDARDALELDRWQEDALFVPPGYDKGRYTRSDAIAAIQSMLDSPDDDALPVWPSREGVSA